MTSSFNAVLSTPYSVLSTRIAIAFGAAAIILSLFTPASAADSWKAGVAKANITPDTYMWMAGYAARTRPADGKMTELWAKALAVEDAAGQRAVLVTLDLVGIDRALS